MINLPAVFKKKRKRKEEKKKKGKTLWSLFSPVATGWQKSTRNRFLSSSNH